MLVDFHFCAEVAIAKVSDTRKNIESGKNDKCILQSAHHTELP